MAEIKNTNQDPLTQRFMTTVICAVVVAIIYFGRPVLMPLALAVLLSFALAPLVGMLRHLRLGHGHAPVRGGMSPVNLFTVLVFLCWFGGVGYLLGLHHGLAAATVMVLAALSGMVAASGVFVFLVKVLMPRERLAIVVTVIIGMAESFGGFYFSTDYKDIIAFVLLVVILSLRPQGLFTAKGAR